MMSTAGGSTIPRRTFLHWAAATAGAVPLMATAAGQEASVASSARKTGYTYWMHGIGKGDPKEQAKALREAGFNIVVAGGDAVIEAVREAGMDSWLCGGAFGLGDLAKDDSHKAVDITGKPQVWFGSGSPNDPVILDRNLKAYEKMAATEGVKGILVDGCRFASPASGIQAFFTDFSVHSEKKASALGFDFEKMRQDVKALYDLVMSKGKDAKRGINWLKQPVGILEWLTYHPGILEWLRFRRVCSTEHFKNISEIIHGAGKKMGVYIFTPSFAPLVGQSYVDLCDFVDVFAPMIYRNYPDRPGPACLNWELTIIPEELGLAGTQEEAEAMELLLRWTGLDKWVATRSIEHIRTAIPPETVGHETAMARALIGAEKTLAPIIYIDDPLMGQTADLVQENGADGLNFFVIKEQWADMVRPAFS